MSTTTVSCPSCQQPLSPQAPVCGSCGLPLTGASAAALWQLDQEIAGLQARREQLLATLRAEPIGSTAEMEPVGPYRLSAQAPESDDEADELPRRRDSWRGQQILLAAGALLVLTAAVVFLAVAWSVIGVAGQVAVMALATVLAGWASVRTKRRGLGATAEALALVTVGLAVVDVAAAYGLDLAGLQSFDLFGYAAGAAAGLTVAFAAVASRQALHTFPIAAVLTAAVTPLLTFAAAEPSVVAAAVIFLLAAGAFVTARVFLSPGRRAARLLLLVAAVGYLLASWLTAVTEVFVADSLGSSFAAALVALAGAAAVGWRSGLHLGLIAAAEHFVGAGSALLVIVLSGVGLTWRADATGVTSSALVVVAAVTAAALAASARPLRTGPLGVVALLAQLATGVGLVAAHVGDQATLDEHSLSWAALTLAAAVTAAGAVVTAARRRSVRPLAVGYAAAVALLAVYRAAWPSGVLAVTLAFTLTAVLLAALAAWRRPRFEERILAAAALIAALLAADHAMDLTPRHLALVLAVVGLGALTYGALPNRGLVSLGGVAGCSAAIWVVLADRDVTTVEAYSLPLAALIAVVGFGRLHREPTAPSWLTLGPALTAALLPSAVVGSTDEQLTRPLLVLVAGTVVLVVGVMARWQSPVLVGSVAVLIITVSQLAPYAVGLPRWLTFGTLGLALLVLGARYEQRRRNAQQAARWVAALR